VVSRDGFFMLRTSLFFVFLFLIRYPLVPYSSE